MYCRRCYADYFLWGKEFFLTLSIRYDHASFCSTVTLIFYTGDVFVRIHVLLLFSKIRLVEQ
jgi:hypothetical protein